MRVTRSAAPLALKKRSFNVNRVGTLIVKSPIFLNMNVPRNMAGITKVRALIMLNAKPLIIAINAKNTVTPISAAKKAFQWGGQSEHQTDVR